MNKIYLKELSVIVVIFLFLLSNFAISPIRNEKGVLLEYITLGLLIDCDGRRNDEKRIFILFLI